jgi:uncharacterized membrane protein YdbT with pleckstrin-like domain
MGAFMSYVEKHLLPGESIVYRAHLHWIIYLQAALIILVGILIAVVGSKSASDSAPLSYIVATIFFIIGLLMFFSRWITDKTSEFAVTNKRILVKVGFIRRTSLELLLRQIEMIGVEQGVFARMLGYGTIIVGGTGGTKEQFAYIANPLEFRRQVQGQSADPAVIPPQTAVAGSEKTCPACAEQVKAAATVCRYCGHQFA